MASAQINYTPSPTIGAFIKEYLPGHLFHSFVIGPVGSAKTTGISFKLVYMASLQAPSPIDGIRRSRAVVVRNTMPQLRDTTLSSWNYWFKDGVAGTWRATNSSFLLKFGDVECEVLFRPLDTPDDVARVLSLEVTFVILDEFVQIHKDIVEALSARCGRYPPALEGGATNWGMWGASNPGNEDSWWYRMLESEPNVLDDSDAPAGLPPNWFYFKQPSGFSPDAENLENLPGGTDYYTSLAQGKTDAWVKQFIEVEWGYSLGGTPVLRSFNPKLHISSTPLIFNPALPLVAGFDPGLAGSALVFGQLDRHGRLLVLSELVQSNMGAERICKERLWPHMHARYPGIKLADLIVTPDPAAMGRANSDEKSVVDTLKKLGLTIKVPTLNNRLEPRIQAMEHFTTRLTLAGPAFLVDPSCKHLIQALRTGWRYKARSMSAQGDVGEVSPDPEKNASSHPADAATYLARYLVTGEKGSVFSREDRMPRGIRTTRNNYHFR